MLKEDYPLKVNFLHDFRYCLLLSRLVFKIAGMSANSTENVSCVTLCVGLCLEQEVWDINEVVWHKNIATDSD